MEEEIFLLLGEGFELYEEEVEEMEDDSSDLDDEGDDSSSDKSIGWELLPEVCLRHVFGSLPDIDRRSAALVCHQWHHAMRSPCLWRTHIFHFSGCVSKTECRSAISYVRSLGHYLQKLTVCVNPPHKPSMAQRLERNISSLLSELRRVHAPLMSLCIPMLELNGSSWNVRLRSSLVLNLIQFFHKGATKLTSLCLDGMRNNLHHGLDLLNALSCRHRLRNARYSISSLQIVGFFRGHLDIHLNKDLPNALRLLHGLTHLSLSYACLSDTLLSALQCREPGCKHKSNTLQRFSLYCTESEPHQQLVSGAAWAALASRCPDMQVELLVDQIVNTDRLARILLPEIPLVKFTMKAFYSPDEDWSGATVLSDILPQYRHSLKHLSLDLCDSGDTLDDVLLELVAVLGCLEQLMVCAFLDIESVGSLLNIRQRQKSLFKKIKMKIYTLFDDVSDQEKQLEQILSSYENLLTGVECCITLFPLLDT